MYIFIYTILSVVKKAIFGTMVCIKFCSLHSLIYCLFYKIIGRQTIFCRLFLVVVGTIVDFFLMIFCYMFSQNPIHHACVSVHASNLKTILLFLHCRHLGVVECWAIYVLLSYWKPQVYEMVVVIYFVEASYLLKHFH